MSSPWKILLCYNTGSDSLVQDLLKASVSPVLKSVIKASYTSFLYLSINHHWWVNWHLLMQSISFISFIYPDWLKYRYIFSFWNPFKRFSIKRNELFLLISKSISYTPPSLFSIQLIHESVRSVMAYITPEILNWLYRSKNT